MILVVTVLTKTVTKVELLCEMVLVLEEVDVMTEIISVVDDCNDEDGLALSLVLVLMPSDVEEVVDRLCEVEAPIELGLSLADPFCDIVDKTVLLPSFEGVVPVAIIPENDPDIVDNDILPSVLWACEFEDGGAELELLSPVGLTGGIWIEVLEKVLLLGVVLFIEPPVESRLVVVALWLSVRVAVEVAVSDPAMFELVSVRPLPKELDVVMETVEPCLEVEVSKGRVGWGWPEDVVEIVPLEAKDVLDTPEGSLLVLFAGWVLPLLEEDADAGGEIVLTAEAGMDEKVENPDRVAGLSLDVVVVVGTRTEDKEPESDVIVALVLKLVLDEDIRSEPEVVAVVD